MGNIGRDNVAVIKDVLQVARIRFGACPFFLYVDIDSAIDHMAIQYPCFALSTATAIMLTGNKVHYRR